MRKTFTFSLLMVCASVFAFPGSGDDDPVNVNNSKRTTATPDLSRLRMNYRPTDGVLALPKTIRRAPTGGLVANFSVQDSSAQEPVWTEGFDESLDNWVIDHGEGDAIEFSLKTMTRNDFSTIDPSSVKSLFIEGPFQKYKRTIGTATSADIAVPANGQLNAYVYANSTWNSYSTLAVQVSTDDFVSSTEVWNSKNVSDGTSQWYKIEAPLDTLAGKNIKLRIVYGPGTDDSFNTGGYMGDYYVDGISVTGVSPIDQVNVKTGEEIRLADLSTGNPTSWEWSFPGGSPATSTEQNPVVFYTKAGTYDVTLTVRNENGENTVTRTAFVVVEGQAPAAVIGWPSEFRDLTTRMRMIAPLAPVTYTDKSTGFPTDFSWAIYSQYELAAAGGGFFQPTDVFTTKDVEYKHEKLNKYYVTHIAQNETGYTFEDDSVQVQFGGLVTNFRPEDAYQTNFVDGDLTLPGSNKMGITAWAEKFSKPARPMLMDALYVNFTKAHAEGIADQIANVSFSLYTSKDGLPDQNVDLLDTWTVSELNYALTTNNGIVTVELGKKYIIDDEFFIVISGIPEKNDSLECAIAMAPMRDKGNTAYMLNKGSWRPMTGYLQAAPGGQTSLAVFPHIQYSVLIPAKIDEMGGITMDNDTVVVGHEQGKASKMIFSPIGYRYIGSDSEWCRVVGEPGEYTVDTLDIRFDAIPEDIPIREAVLSFTDSIDTLQLHVIQRADLTTDISSVTTQTISQGETVVYDLNGRRIDAASSHRGIYIIREGDKTRKIMRR